MANVIMKDLTPLRVTPLRALRALRVRALRALRADPVARCAPLRRCAESIISMSKRNIGLGRVYGSGEAGFLPAVEPPAVLLGQRLELRIFCELFCGMSRPEGIV